MTVQIPRLLIAAGRSGAGKTMASCGLIQALKERGHQVSAFKCGPDYIDPMFHREALGVASYNLDSFLCGKENMREILACRGAAKKTGESGEPLAILEGVMGYYDGLGGCSVQASTYDTAEATDTPVVFVADCKGASVSVVPYIKGFLAYKEEERVQSGIRGVLLNRISPMLYGRVKERIEKETSVKVYGYLPDMEELSFESRYLGLKLPGEVRDIQKKLKAVGACLEKTVDLDGLVRLAQSAPGIETAGGEACFFSSKRSGFNRIRIGAAKDQAFCFIYEDNLRILRELGAEIVPFSPLEDKRLPDNLDGIVLYGGYPELFAEKLSANISMREDIKAALENGLPCMAECGGFQYLQEAIRDEKGNYHPMCAFLPGESFPSSGPRRFGYVTLSGGKVFGKEVGEISAHEFHYYDSRQCGEAFTAKKPLSNRSWKCMISTETLLAGYPHIHYAGNRKVAEAFLEACVWKRN